MYFDLISCFANGCVCACVHGCVCVWCMRVHTLSHIVTVPPESKLLQSRTHVYIQSDCQSSLCSPGVWIDSDVCMCTIMQLYTSTLHNIIYYIYMHQSVQNLTFNKCIQCGSTLLKVLYAHCIRIISDIKTVTMQRVQYLKNINNHN